MSCFWKDLKGTAQTCFEASGFLHELGAYVYIGYEDPDPDYSLIEVKKDLSGYIKHGLVGAGFDSADSLFSKGRKVFALSYDTVPNPDVASLYRHDGAGIGVEIAGIPNLSPSGKRAQFLGGKLRSVAEPDASTLRLYESDDGESWVAVTPGFAIAGLYFTDYTQMGARLIAASNGGMWYSDDSGATWNAGTGDTTGGGNSTAMVHSGSNLIAATGLRAAQVTSDGAAWTPIPNMTIAGGTIPVPPAASGSGLAVMAGENTLTGDATFWRSTNHGGSWSSSTFDASGVPDFSVCYGLFWDGAQFVGLFQRGDTSGWQVYLSPTGATWTAGITIPQIHSGAGLPAQLID